VHHTPQFSVFTDDQGIGKDQVDLFTTNPNPNLGGRGFNDHIPSNLRLGMDGWFYMTTGDKGIYGAVGRDGSKVNLQGGGIMRFRPDATQLEIYANGTRNHLDVAINAEDEMFTYDNTDDGLGWFTRVSHMVDGGFYGYPYDYKPQRPYTLWMMTDYGGGSPTGAIAYNEDALPEEYRGNLFLCEWGRRQLLRLKVSRDGATYKIDSRVQAGTQDFMVPGTREFRPNGIAISPDGLSFYIADWNFNGWRRPNAAAGRLLKVTYTGPSQAAPKPQWWIPAAMGRPFQASTGDLIAGLRHPAQSVRLVAQRRLAERGLEAVAPLKKLLADAKAPAQARWHTIWTLDAMDGGVSARQDLLTVATQDRDISVRAQAIRELGTRRAREAVKPLADALKDSSAVIRFHAATALGRIGDSSAVAAMLPALEEKDLFARYSIFKALNRIGRADGKAWGAIAMGFQSKSAAVREGVGFALRDAFDDQNVKALADFVASKQNPPQARAEALTALAELHHQRPAWTGTWWNTQPARGLPPAKTVEWSGTSNVLASIQTGLQDSELVLRRAAVLAIAVASDTPAGPRLREMFTHETSREMQLAVLRALGNVKDSESGSFLAGILANPAKNADLFEEAIPAAGKIGGKSVTDALIALADSSSETNAILVANALGAMKSIDAVPAVVQLIHRSNAAVRTASKEALVSIGSPAGGRGGFGFGQAASPNAAANAAVTLLDDPDLEVRRTAIQAVGQLKTRRAVPKLLALYQSADTRIDAIKALVQIPDTQALEAYLDGLASTDPALVNLARIALENMQVRDQVLKIIEEKHQQKPFTGQVLAALQRVYGNTERAKEGPLFVGSSKPTSLEDYVAFAGRNVGNVEKGRAIFQGPIGCANCHKASGIGADIGPDLTGVAAKYNRASLIESVLYPSKQILDGCKSIVVDTKDGETYTGFVREENTKEFILVDGAGVKHPIAKDQVNRRSESNFSLMPDGLQAGLSLDDFSDLITYLESLKEKSPGTRK
jgi:putative heme-binding domain-containing protein